MRVGLLITTYNRPEYLRQCLLSISKADVSQLSTIMIIDDASTDEQTHELIDGFAINGVDIIKYKSSKNQSIKGSLLTGLDILFNICDSVINLDGDAIVAPNFVSVLTSLKNRFPDNLITGFNCLTRNRDGSERHMVLETGDGYSKRKSVGGINLLFDKTQYQRWVYPTLHRCLANGGNWDDHTCRASMSEGKEIITSVPSVVQHIGINSSMGHSAGGESPDVADDFVGEEDRGTRLMVKKDGFGVYTHATLYLPSVTLVGADCVNIDRLLKAADISCKNILFGAVKMFSSIPSDDPRVISIPHMKDKADYSVFMMKELGKYIESSHLLVIQYDGFVLDFTKWIDTWLNYDYIGAPWEWYTDGRGSVGNGGFSLRSKRLHDILMSDANIVPMNEPGVTKWKEEDHCICRLYRSYLENTHKIKFAPVDEARKFSIEGWRSKNRTWNGEFGFHGHTSDITKSGYTI